MIARIDYGTCSQCGRPVLYQGASFCSPRCNDLAFGINQSQGAQVGGEQQALVVPVAAPPPDLSSVRAPGLPTVDRFGAGRCCARCQARIPDDNFLDVCSFCEPKPEKRSCELCRGDVPEDRAVCDACAAQIPSTVRPLLAFDVEAELITDERPIPPLVCAQFANENDYWLFHHTDAKGPVEAALRSESLIVGHYIAFDMAAVCYQWPDLAPLVFQAYEDDRVTDTMLREKLCDIALGMYFDGIEYPLEKVVRARCNIQLEKGNWQLRFGELKDLPVEQWPEEARHYALADVVTTLAVYREQERVSSHWLVDQYRQARASFALELMSAYGLHTDEAAVRAYKQGLESKFAKLAEEMVAHGLMRRVSTKKKKTQIIETKLVRTPSAVQKRVEQAYAAKKKIIPRTLPSAKHPEGQIRTDADTCTHSGDEVLVHYADLSSTSTLLSTYVPLLERAQHLPLHVRFTSLLSTGRTSSSPNCFDGETEVLTRRGWMRFFDLQEGDSVAQWNSGVIEFVHPTGAVKTRVEEVVEIKLAQVDLVTTRDHRCLLQHRKTGEFRIFRADEYPEDWRQLQAGQFLAGATRIPYWFLTLLVATQADGWFDRGALEFGFSKQRKIDRVLEALQQLGLQRDKHFSVHEDAQRGRTRIRLLVGCDLVGALRDWLGGEEKKFQPWVLDLCRENLDHFVEEVFFWDGCWTRKNHYASQHKSNADLVQAALALSGKRARVRRYVNNVGSVSWQVDVTERDYSLTTNRELRIVPRSTEVYCVSVPSSYLLVRRNNCVAITGNCQNLPTEQGVRECFAPRPGFVYIVSDYAGIELRTWAQICWGLFKHSKMREALNAGIDPHTLLASKILGIPYEQAVEEFSRDRKGRVYLPRQASKALNFGRPGGAGLDRWRDYAQSNYGVEVPKDDPSAPIDAKRLFRFWSETWTEAELYAKWCSDQCEHGQDGLGQLEQAFVKRFRGGLRYTELSNSGFQGLASDIAKLALWLVTKACYIDTTSPLFGSRLVNFIHDELVTETPDTANAHEAAMEQERLMIKAAKEFLPDITNIEAETALCRRWSKAAKPMRDASGRLVPWDLKKV